MSCRHHLYLVPEPFRRPGGAPVPTSSHPRILLPQPRAATNLSFVLGICLFWMCRVNGIIQRVPLCPASLELSTLFSRFIHV